jgi:hypothetical protein
MPHLAWNEIQNRAVSGINRRRHGAFSEDAGRMTGRQGLRSVPGLAPHLRGL